MWTEQKYIIYCTTEDIGANLVSLWDTKWWNTTLRAGQIRNHSLQVIDIAKAWKKKILKIHYFQPQHILHTMLFFKILQI